MAKKTRRSVDGEQKMSPTTTADAARRGPTPIEVANAVVTRTRLRRIRFSKFSAHASLAMDSVEDEVHLRASTHFGRPTVDSRDEETDRGFCATSTLEFRLGKTAPSANPGDDDPCVVVKATLKASYTFKDDSPDFTEEQLETFALHYCPFHVWGYWREFVHSSLARLEFPTLTVPLFQIDMAQALVVDEVD